VHVVSFNELSRVRPSVNRDSERIYGCVARSAIVAKQTTAAAVKPKNRPGPARPGHVNITPVITAVDFDPFHCTILVHRAMRCISAAYAVIRCLSFCLCVCHVRELRQNE